LKILQRVVDRIITPYNADAYKSYLSRFNLTDKYPDLVFNLRNGFPISDMPSLSRTYTPPNHKSALEHPEVICDYLAEECSFSCMSGPYTRSQIEQELGGHFVSCPLGLVEKAGEPRKFRIIRDLSYKNKEDNYSVNSFLDADDFPTEWGTASQVAEIISLLFHYLSRIYAFAPSATISFTPFAFFYSHLQHFFLSHLLRFHCTFCIFSHIFCVAPLAFQHHTPSAMFLPSSKILRFCTFCFLGVITHMCGVDFVLHFSFSLAASSCSFKFLTYV
jgi:hypothetical protein